MGYLFNKLSLKIKNEFDFKFRFSGVYSFDQSELSDSNTINYPGGI